MKTNLKIAWQWNIIQFYSNNFLYPGSIRIIKKLDRDLPNGYPVWSTFIFAKDENGGPTGIENYVEFEVILEDINDNPPFLDMPDGLVWTENQRPGIVFWLKKEFLWLQEKWKHLWLSSAVKDSNVDSGVIFKFLPNPPIIKAVCTKIFKKLHICQYFEISERK